MAKMNSIVNQVYASATNGQPVPAVDMGITILHWTDRSAGTITRVAPSGKTFWWKPDVATRIDKNGMSEMQEYSYEPQPDAAEQVARLNKNNQWVSAGQHIRVGERRAYHDFSF